MDDRLNWVTSSTQILACKTGTDSHGACRLMRERERERFVDMSRHVTELLLMTSVTRQPSLPPAFRERHSSSVQLNYISFLFSLCFKVEGPYLVTLCCLLPWAWSAYNRHFEATLETLNMYQEICKFIRWLVHLRSSTFDIVQFRYD